MPGIPAKSQPGLNPVLAKLQPDPSSVPSGPDPGGWLFNSGAQNDGQMTVN